VRANSLIVRAFLFRGALLWVVTRLTVTIFLVLAGSAAIKLSAIVFAEVIFLIVALGWIETRRRRELTLLGNLGVSPLLLTILYGVPALSGELALRIGASVLP
jgi:hypothetical protein